MYTFEFLLFFNQTKRTKKILLLCYPQKAKTSVFPLISSLLFPSFTFRSFQTNDYVHNKLEKVDDVNMMERALFEIYDRQHLPISATFGHNHIKYNSIHWMGKGM